MLYKNTKIKIVLVSLILFFSVIFNQAADHKKVEIRTGMNASQIAGLLQEFNIIKSKNIFLLLLYLSGNSKKIRAGTYMLALNSNYLKLINRLTKGSDYHIKITIPEGFTSEQIAERLYVNEVIREKSEFIQRIKDQGLRGYLFPETYNFTPGIKPEEVIQIMTDQFWRVFDGRYRKRTQEMGSNVKDIIILASLIEKEAKISEERQVISAIFQKRLRKRMYLESCASVLFALGKHKEKLRYKDLQIDSPYNTYRNFGLPPTPICNPGKEAVHAALYPAETDYLFFFTKGDGSHIFSSSYEKHLELQKNYKK
ncbi:endolytic transglycosylase MltG [Elusimicrobiota bacterium]